MLEQKRLINFFESRPDIGEKIIFDGTFRDYAVELGKSALIKNNLKRKIKEEAERLLPSEVSLEALENQLSSYPLISYADHHGLLNYKLLFNSNILYSLIIKELELPFMVVFATGNIPLINISYPRGFYFKESKFNFFRKRLINTPVFLVNEKLKGLKNEGIESFILNYSKESINPEEKKFLEHLFFDCLEIEKSGQIYDTFSDQLTFLNYKLWKYYFDRSIRNKVPNMLYLQSNKIILEILLDEIENEDSLINNILFIPEIRRVYLKNFHGVPGCWGEKMGSQLFWGVVESKGKKRIINLRIDDNSNSLNNENFSIFLEKEAIINALKAKKILPTIFFDFLIVTFMEGYLALGGWNQLAYLPQMQESHVNSLKEIGMQDMAKKFAAPIAHGLICGMYPFDFNSGIDLIWHYNSSNDEFNGNMDGGLTQEDLDKVSNMVFTDLISKSIDETLSIF